MTFEDTDNRARATAADEAIAPASRAMRRASTGREGPVDAMLNFATEGEIVATQLRGLAALFRGVFCDDDVRGSDDASAAADIVDDVLKSIAHRLDDNAEQARATRDHLIKGGAR